MYTRIEGSLRKFGVKEQDRFNIVNDPLMLYKVERPKKPLVYLGVLKPPLSGQYFAQVMSETSISPEEDGILGVEGDYPIPASGHYRPVYETGSGKGEESHDGRLLRLHLNDPRIRKPFREFCAQSMGIWNINMHVAKHDPVYQAFGAVRFVDPELYGQRALEDYIYCLQKKLLRYPYAQQLAEFRNGAPLLASLRRQSEFNDPNLSDADILSEFTQVNPHREQNHRYTFEFMTGIPVEDQMEIAMRLNSYRDEKILLNTQNGEIYSHCDRLLKDVRIDRTSDLTYEIRGKSVRLTVVPDLQNPVSAIYQRARITDTAPDWYMRGIGISPVFAWKVGENGRQFLGQLELLRLLADERIFTEGQPDVYSAKVISGIFARRTVSSWGDHMELKDGDFAQEMTLAQQAVRHSIKVHEDDLLADSNPFYPALEKAARKARPPLSPHL